MIEYRSFRNTDPPLISAIWAAQPPMRGLIPAARPNFLAEHVFGKPYFDRQGFILALLEGKTVGFAHAGFGPAPAGDRLDYQSGVVSLIMTDNHPRSTEVASGLLAACESYLTERGARRVLSLVTYLNPGWQLADGGELAIYDGQGAQIIHKVMPAYGTVVVFLSTEVPHEVLPANRDRYSIAGWFRVNSNHADRPDPPR